MDCKKVKSENNKKPHAVFIPFPAQGHLTPMIQLAKLFHHRGFYITFINAHFIHKLLFKSGSLAHSLLNLPDFHFETFPDGLSESFDLFSLCESSRNNFCAPLQSLVSRLGGSGPAVSCVVADCNLPFAIGIAKEVGVPCWLYWGGNAGAFMGFKHHRHLKERGLIPPTDGNLDNIIDWIPGLKDVRLRDLPLVHIYKYDFPMKELEEAFKASGIIFNTFKTLEEDVLNAISSMFPHIYAIGPLHQMLLNDDVDELKSIGPNLLEEEPQCLQWLNSMNPNSVIYISFGSTTVMTPHHLTEFAWGILNSNHPFLWIIRPNSVINNNDEPTTLPPELLSKAKERGGLIATWCPQEQVLNHPSIGGFVTHCGWNSTLESISAGVPVICWPWLGDHQLICRYSCTQWGIGIEINNDVKRDEVERLVRELMEGGEGGKKLKKKAMEWKTLAMEATSEGGSSSSDLEKLVKEAAGHSYSNVDDSI